MGSGFFCRVSHTPKHCSDQIWKHRGVFELKMLLQSSERRWQEGPVGEVIFKRIHKFTVSHYQMYTWCKSRHSAMKLMPYQQIKIRNHENNWNYTQNARKFAEVGEIIEYAGWDPFIVERCYRSISQITKRLFLFIILFVLHLHRCAQFPKRFFNSPIVYPPPVQNKDILPNTCIVVSTNNKQTP